MADVKDESSNYVSINSTEDSNKTLNSSLDKTCDETVDCDEDDDSDSFLIKRGRPKKSKRTRPKKQKATKRNDFSNTDPPVKKIKVKTSGVSNGNIEQNIKESVSKPEGFIKQHEDLRGTAEGENMMLKKDVPSNIKHQEDSDSDEELNLSDMKKNKRLLSGHKLKGGHFGKKKKTYKECTQMLRIIANQALKKDENSEDHSKKEENDEDSQNTTCMICKETVPIYKWDKHKMKVHYNLAWCKEENSIDIHDEAIIFDNLKRIKEVYEQLNCYKCGFVGTRIKEFWQHVEKCSEIVSPSGMVECAVCNGVMVKSSWISHRYKSHNNLAWRVNEPPIDLNDQTIIIHILNKIYKERKPLTCENCGRVVKSVIGFLSHKSTCGKSAEELEKLKIECSICNRMIFPVSMEVHLKSHKEKQEAIDEMISVNTPLLKRKAADRAKEEISAYVDNLKVTNMATVSAQARNFYLTPDDKYFRRSIKYRLEKMNLATFQCLYSGCEAEFANVTSCLDHFKVCSQRPEKVLVCKDCLKVLSNETEMINHLNGAHQKKLEIQQIAADNLEGGKAGHKHFVAEANSSDYEDEDDQMAFEMELPDNVQVFRKREKTAFEIRQLQSNEKFSELINETPWPLLDVELLENFLPKTTESCDVFSKRLLSGNEKVSEEEDFQFRKISLFEAARLSEEDITIFCGGPVTALAWLPTIYEDTDCPQILAVAVSNDMDYNYLTDCNYSEPSLIQLWDYGVLKNRQEEIPMPTILYNIAVNFGPIWHMEWCPSGCYSSDCDYNRLGLLAAAGSDSFVYIFVVDNVPENHRELVFKGNPCVRLMLIENAAEADSGTESYYPTKISWTKAAGHQYVAVGYSNGYVALFNLGEAEQNLHWNSTVAGQTVLFPYFKFVPQVATPITGLSLSHLGQGNTFLMTCSHDKDVCLWDLRTMNCITSLRIANPSEAIWLTHWLGTAYCDDKDGAKELTVFNSKSRRLSDKCWPVNASVWIPRQFMSRSIQTNYSFSKIKSLSFNDWLNALVHGSYMGEIIGSFSHQLARNISGNKKVNMGTNNCLFSSSMVVKKIRFTDCDKVTNYQETIDKFGLVFCDYDLTKENFPKEIIKHKTLSNSEYLKDTTIEHYPLQAINKLVCNPNAQACTYFVAGYNSGLVRLKRMRFVADRHYRMKRR